MKVVATERSQLLGSRIAGALGVGMAEARFSRFPDGEHSLQRGPLDGETVVVGSVVDADSLVQLLLLLDACRESEVSLVVPYLGYARQDRAFREGEPVSARAIAGALGRGVSRVVTVHVHKETVLPHFGAPARNVNLEAAIAGYIGTLGLTRPAILAPDHGALAFARAVASVGGWEAEYLEKTRISGTEVRMEAKHLDARGRDMVMVDDIISTGHTLAAAAKMLRAAGARGVHAIGVHGVFVGGALDLLQNAGIREIACSDTIESGSSRFSAAAGIASALSR
jgi:ribose-phosphate pyrophosphokinase